MTIYQITTNAGITTSHACLCKRPVTHADFPLLIKVQYIVSNVTFLILCDDKHRASSQQNAGQNHNIEIANKIGHTANTGKWFPLQGKAWSRMALFVKEFCQYVKLLYCHTNHILQICHLQICSHSYDWNKHWKAIAILTFRPVIWQWQNRSATFQSDFHDCFKPPEMLEAVYWCRKLFWRKSLAQECKYTILIFILSVSVLFRHRLYLGKTTNPNHMQVEIKSRLYLRNHCSHSVQNLLSYWPNPKS